MNKRIGVHLFQISFVDNQVNYKKTDEYSERGK